MRTFIDQQFIQYARCDALDIIDIHKESKKSGRFATKKKETSSEVFGPEPTLKNGISSEIEHWLPFAAKPYNISPDIKDYLIIPVVTIPADLPNRNRVAFPLKALVQFQPEFGCCAYQTLKGKPVHYEHDNQDPSKAYGVIVDAYLKKFAGFGNGDTLWKIVQLLAIDRTKHADTASAIQSGQLNSYSMGCYVGHYTCSYCGGEIGKECSHLAMKNDDLFDINGQLVFKNCHDLVFFETSIVSSPAFVPAVSDTIIDMSQDTHKFAL